MTPVLVAVGPSHYCEKARWALQRAGIAFRETTTEPTLRTRRKAPVLMADGELIADTAEILLWVDKRTASHRRLIPDEPRLRAEVLALERQFDGELGPQVQKIADAQSSRSGRSLVRVRAVYGEVGDRLADGRRYLVGERFSAADLTFAALASPLLFPGNPDLVAMPAPLGSIARELRATPAGRFALRLIQRERG